MGLFSAIGNIAKKAAENFTVAVQKPVQYVTATISDLKTGGNKAQTLVNNQLSKPLATQIKDIVVSTGTAALAVVATAPTAVRAAIVKAAPVVGKAIQAVAPTTKGKIIAAIAAPVAVGAVIREPYAVSKAITKAPGELANFGGDVAGLIANPSVEKAKELVSESPLISAGAGLLVAGGIAKAVVPAISGIATREAIKEQTNVIKSGGISLIPLDEVPQTANSLVPISPQTGQTQTLASTTTRKVTKYKKKKPILPTSINQKVNVIVSNKSSSVGVKQSKNYIKRELLA